MMETRVDHMMDPTSYLSKKEAERTKETAVITSITEGGIGGPNLKRYIKPKAMTIITKARSVEAMKAFMK